VADAELPSGDAAFDCGFCGSAGKPDLRRRPCGAIDNNISERHAVTEPCSQRLQNGFLRGKPAGQALDPVGSVADLVEFLLSETARGQWIARILDPAPDLGDIDQIDPVSDEVHIHRQSLTRAQTQRLEEQQRDVRAEQVTPIRYENL